MSLLLLSSLLDYNPTPASPKLPTFDWYSSHQQCKLPTFDWNAHGVMLPFLAQNETSSPPPNSGEYEPSSFVNFEEQDSKSPPHSGELFPVKISTHCGEHDSAFSPHSGEQLVNTTDFAVFEPTVSCCVCKRQLQIAQSGSRLFPPATLTSTMTVPRTSTTSSARLQPAGSCRYGELHDDETTIVNDFDFDYCKIGELALGYAYQTLSLFPIFSAAIVHRSQHPSLATILEDVTPVLCTAGEQFGTLQ